MNARKITPDKAEIIEKQRGEEGRSITGIARALGLPKGTVSWHCLANAIDKPGKQPATPRGHALVYRRGDRDVRHFRPTEDAKLEGFVAAGESYASIGRRLGRAPNSVRNRLMTLARREERQLMQAAE